MNITIRVEKQLVITDAAIDSFRALYRMETLEDPTPSQLQEFVQEWFDDCAEGDVTALIEDYQDILDFDMLPRETERD